MDARVVVNANVVQIGGNNDASQGKGRTKKDYEEAKGRRDAQSIQSFDPIRSTHS